MRFLGFRFLWGHKPKKADVFLLLLSRRRTKEGFPCGGRKGAARSERSILSPSTELERRQATSGRTTAGHKVTGLWPDAAGYLSLRPFRQQVGPVPTDRSFLCLFLWLSGAKKEGCRDLPDERAGWPAAGYGRIRCRAANRRKQALRPEILVRD